MKYLISFIILLIVSQSGYSSQLNDSSKISILTCGSGSELYSIFGHTAIRVKDPAQNLDKVFNYGTFSFSDDFYVKFTMGKLNYFLSTQDFESFSESYAEENRSIIEQELNLSTEQRNHLYAFLQQNLLPENKYYLYDFFYNNCSTKEIDVLQKTLGSDFILPPDYNKKTDKSFRDLTDPYIENNMPWSDFGIDLGLGSVTDKKTTELEQTYLPIQLYDFLKKTSVHSSGGLLPMIKSEQIIYKAAPGLDQSTSISPGKLFISAFILISIFSIIEIKNKRLYKWIDFLVFFTMGLLGVLLLFLWIGTDHTATARNYNLIWASPLHLLLAFAILMNANTKLLIAYSWFTLILCTLLLIAWGLVPQDLHEAAIPLILIIIARAGLRVQYFTYKTKTSRI